MPDVDIDGVGTIEFPDSMQPDEIKSAIDKIPFPTRWGTFTPPQMRDHLQKRFSAIVDDGRKSTAASKADIATAAEEYRNAHGQYPDANNPPPEIKSLLPSTREDFNQTFKQSTGDDATDADWAEAQRQRTIFSHARHFSTKGIATADVETVPEDMRQEVLARTKELSEGKPPSIGNWNLPGAWLAGGIGTLANTAESLTVDPKTRGYANQLRSTRPTTETGTWSSLPARTSEMAGMFLNPVGEIAPLELTVTAHGDTKANLMAQGVPEPTAEKAALAVSGITAGLFALPGLIKGDPESRTIVGQWVAKKLGDRFGANLAASGGDVAQHLAVGQGIMTGIAVSQADIEEAAKASAGLKSPEYWNTTLNAAKESLNSLGPLALLMTPQFISGISSRANQGKLSRSGLENAAREAGIDPGRLPQTSQQQRDQLLETLSGLEKNLQDKQAAAPPQAPGGLPEQAPPQSPPATEAQPQEAQDGQEKQAEQSQTPEDVQADGGQKGLLAPAASAEEEPAAQQPPPVKPNTPEKDLPSGPDVTAARNAITQAITGEARPAVDKEGHTQEELLDNADPRRARGIIDRIKANPLKGIDELEVNDLNVFMKLRRDAYAEAVQRGDKAGAALAQDDVRETARALQITGTAQGRALASRQANIEQDWSFGHMLQQAEEDNEEPLSAEEQKKIMQRARQMQALNKEIDSAERTAVKERRDETVKKVLDDVAAGKGPEDVPLKVEARFRKFMEVVDSWWNPKVDAARSRMKEFWKGTKLTAGLEPQVLADMAIIGADYIKRGATTLASWTAKMVDEFGENIRPHAPQIWDAIDPELDKQQADLKAHLAEKPAAATPEPSKPERKPIKPKAEKPTSKPPEDRLKDIIKDAGKKAKESVDSKAEILKKMKARLGNKSALNFQVWKLMYEFASGGIKTIEDMHKAVHAELLNLDPDWTERQTMEAMGGYGDYKRPTIDQAKRVVTDLHRQAQGLSKLKTIIEDKIAPLRSGVGREPPSDEARKIERQVQQEMLKHGIEATDPATQQRSMLDARKRQRRNAISDMQDAIESNSRIERSKVPAPTDAELKALDDKYGITQADYEQHFSAELEVDRLEKSINDVADQVKRAKAGEDIRKGKAKTPEAKGAKIEALQANLDALKAERESLKRTNAAVLARRAEARREAITARANELREQLATKKFPEKQASQQPTNAEIEKGLAEVKELQRRVKLARKAQEEADMQVWEGEGGSLKQKIEPSAARKLQIAIKAREAGLLRQIADYKSRTAEGEFGPKPVKAPVAWPKEILDRIKQRDEAVAEWEKQRRKWQWENRTWKERVLDGMRKFAQTTVLTGSGSLWKISAASLLRFVKLPINELVATGWRLTPVVGELFKESPVYGGGSLDSVLHGWAGGLTKGFIDAYESVTKGKTQFSRYDLDPGLYSRIMRIPGSIHDALKSPGARAVFEHALHHSMRWEVEHGNEMTDPQVIERSKGRAIEAMWRAKLVEKNKIVDSYERLFQHIDKETGKQTLGAKAAETLGTVVMPIKRVPTNFAGQVLEHFTGLVTGSLGVRRFMRDGIQKMTPEERDTVARQLTNGTVGAVGAVLAIGFFAPGVLGGHYMPGEKKQKPGEVPPQGIGSIPPQILHDPMLDVLQTGADMRKNWDENTLADAGIPEKSITSVGAGLLGILDEVPFYRLADTVARLRSEKGWEALAQQQIPLAFREIYGKLNDAASAAGIDKKRKSK